MNNRLRALVVVLLMAYWPSIGSAKTSVERNVVYGMYSGLALLLDVHTPATPKGRGIVVIPGSAWRAPLALESWGLKDVVGERRSLAVPQLLEAGYTLFVINHRATPRFPFPAAVEDAQQAVRFIRESAERFGVDGHRIGVIGASSGGYLASMLGTLDHPIDQGSAGARTATSARVQAVVALYPATDLVAFAETTNGSNALLTQFVGAYLGVGDSEDSPEARLFAQASPTTHVDRDDPPFLLIHGDADRVVPFSQSEILNKRMQESGGSVRLIRIPGGGHGDASFFGKPDLYVTQMIEWFD